MEITLEIAELALAAAKKKGLEIGIPMNIAIVDYGAILYYFVVWTKHGLTGLAYKGLISRIDRMDSNFGFCLACSNLYC